MTVREGRIAEETTHDGRIAGTDNYYRRNISNVSRPSPPFFLLPAWPNQSVCSRAVSYVATPPWDCRETEKATDRANEESPHKYPLLPNRVYFHRMRNNEENQEDDFK